MQKLAKDECVGRTGKVNGENPESEVVVEADWVMWLRKAAALERYASSMSNHREQMTYSTHTKALT